MVLPVTVGVASDPHGHVTEVTCGVGPHRITVNVW